MNDRNRNAAKNLNSNLDLNLELELNSNQDLNLELKLNSDLDWNLPAVQNVKKSSVFLKEQWVFKRGA